MALIAQVLANGILLGGLYGLMALGLALVWGVLEIVNLAHGAFIMLGGYAVYWLFTLAGLDPLLGLLPAMLGMFLFGYAFQRGLLNLVVRSGLLNTLLITFGLDVVLTYMAQLLFSADFRTINPAYAGSSIAIAGVTLPMARLAAFAVAMLLASLVWLLLNRTALGRAIRATAQNLTAARLYGVDPRHLYAVTFGFGAALAGAAGGLYGMVAQVTPYIGASLTAKSFVIAIIGGLENPLGVVLGGLVIGLAEAIASVLFGTTYADVVSFGLLVVVLVLRPPQQLRAG